MLVSMITLRIHTVCMLAAIYLSQDVEKKENE